MIVSIALATVFMSTLTWGNPGDAPSAMAKKYSAEVTAFDTEGGEGLPFLVGKDLRPVWNFKPDTPPVRTLEAFDLTDQNGKKISSKDLKGKVTIVSFFFTQCPGICPMVTKNLSPFQNKFIKDDRIAMISMSVTPEFDTPEKLKKFAKKFDIDARRWHLATGDRKKIYSVARNSFSADTYSQKENDLKELSVGDFLHSENVFLLDQNQKLRGVYMGRAPESIDALIHDAESLVR